MEKVTENLYANQFIPLWKKTTMHEKFYEEGRLGKLLSGGGICHYTCGERITPKQSKYIIEEALAAGLEHFAISHMYSICENDHWSYGRHTQCPVCGGKIVDAATRTVGFLVKASSMTTPKREYDFKLRDYGPLD